MRTEPVTFPVTLPTKLPVKVEADMEVKLLRAWLATVPPFRLVTPPSVVMFGCEAVCSVPVTLVAVTAVEATLDRPECLIQQ